MKVFFFLCSLLFSLSSFAQVNKLICSLSDYDSEIKSEAEISNGYSNLEVINGAFVASVKLAPSGLYKVEIFTKKFKKVIDTASVISLPISRESFLPQLTYFHPKSGSKEFVILSCWIR